MTNTDPIDCVGHDCMACRRRRGRHYWQDMAVLLGIGLIWLFGAVLVMLGIVATLVLLVAYGEALLAAAMLVGLGAMILWGFR